MGRAVAITSAPEDVSISDIIHAVDEKVAVTNKGALPGAVSYEPCLTEQLWEELNEQMALRLDVVASHQGSKIVLVA